MMNESKARLLKLARIVALVAVLAVFISATIYCVIKVGSLDNLNAEFIRSLLPENKLLCVPVIWGLYLLKGISIFFSSEVINVVTGIMYPFPLAQIISLTGIYLEFTLMYLLGKLLGQDYINSHKEDKGWKQIASIQTGNEVIISFVLRILGFFSYDLGSMYLGASGVKYPQFILGSMLGAFINVLLATFLGQYIFTPFCWQMLLIIAIRGALILLAYLLRKKM